MTVAFNDIVSLAPLILECPDFSAPTLSSLLKKWHWSRKPLSSTVNILSVALYDLFGADGEQYLTQFRDKRILKRSPNKDEYLAVLREGCFKYFELGGRCISDPVSLLAGYVQRGNCLNKEYD